MSAPTLQHPDTAQTPADPALAQVRRAERVAAELQADADRRHLEELFALAPADR